MADRALGLHQLILDAADVKRYEPIQDLESGLTKLESEMEEVIKNLHQ